MKKAVWVRVLRSKGKRSGTRVKWVRNTKRKVK
jgi:hypothetical protein